MATQFESKETRVLKTIDSKRYPDTNKDFEKNIRRLNSSVDYMAGYMRVMQKGIDDANKNFIEQIQSFINDLIVLFAGGEPTGFEIGDLKYIIQTLGALFGFGNTWPINLLDAVGHFFSNFLSHVIQLTDLIFDSIEAWMNDFADKLDGVPILGNIADNLADFFNDAHTWANNALEDAADAFDHAQDIVDTIIEAFQGSISVGGAVGDILTHLRDFFLSLFGIDTPGEVLAIGAIPTGMPEDRILGLPAALTYYAGSLSRGSNLLPDPRFENGQIWTNAWTTISTNYSKSGTHSCRIVSAGATPRYFYLSPDSEGNVQQYQVDEGDVYYFESWVYAPASNTGTAGHAYVQLHVEDSSGVNSIQYVTPCSMSVNVKGVWLQMTGTYKIPDGYDLITPLFLLGTDTLSGNVYYVDNCLMREETLIQLLIDNLVNVFTGGSTTGNLVSHVIAQIQSFFSGLFGANTPQSKLIPGAIPKSIAKAGVNCCISPDFEDSTVNRTLTGSGVTGAYSTTQKYSGTQSYRLTVGATTSNRGVYLSPLVDTISESDLTTDIPITISQAYYLEAWVYAPTGNASNSPINIIAKVYDDSGNSSTTTVATVTPTKGTWTQVGGVYQIPNNNRYKHMYVSVQYGSSTTGDLYYIDNATVRHETFAQAIVDGLHQAVNGGSTTSNSTSTVKTNIQSVFSNLFGQNTLGTQVKAGAISRQIANKAGVNSCISPDFEDSTIIRSLTGSGVTGAYSSAQSYIGAQSYELTVGATTSNRGVYLSPISETVSESDLTTGVPVDITQAYLLQCWVYAPVANTGNTPINIVATVYDDAAHSSTTTVATVTPTKGTWTLLSGMYYVPNSQRYNHMYVSVQYGATSTTGNKYYIDNAIVRHETFAQAIVDGLHQAINGGSTTGNATSTIKSNLQTLNTNIWGTTNTGSVVRTAAIPDITRSMSTDMQSTIDGFYQGVNGGSSTGNAVSTIKSNLQSIFNNIFGQTTLGTTVKTAAVPNITRSMSTDLQSTIDNVHQAVNGGSSTGNAASSVKTNMQSIFSNLFGSTTLGTVIKNAAIPDITKDMSTDLDALYTAHTDAIGSGAVIVRTSTSNVTISNSNDGPVYFPTSFFGVNSISSADITVDTASGGFEVSLEGWYRVDLCFKINAGVSAIWNICPVIFKNGSVYRYGADGCSQSTGSVRLRTIMSSFEVYLEAGDNVLAGYDATNATGTISNVLTGESTGTQSYFSISLSNRSLA